jgi:ABC-type bacteriocin/lantibiotic exporter with double-glycine peptidase domain
MLFVEPLVALISLSFFVPQLIFVPLLQKVVNRRARQKVELVRELGELVVAPHDDAGARYRDRIDRIYGVRLQYYALKFLIKFLNNLMNHLAPLSVLMVGGYLVTTGGRPRSVPWWPSSVASSALPTRRASCSPTTASRPRPTCSTG